MEDGFYRSKDPTNSIKVLKENRNLYTLTYTHTLIKKNGSTNLLELQQQKRNYT